LIPVGQVLQDFGKAVHEYKGRLVLQELGEVIGAATAMSVGDGPLLKIGAELH